MKFQHTGHRAFSFSVLTSSFSLNQKHFASSLQRFVLSCPLSSILVFRAPRSGKLKKRKQAAYQSLLMRMGKKIRGLGHGLDTPDVFFSYFVVQRKKKNFQTECEYCTEKRSPFYFFPNFCTVNKGIGRSSTLVSTTTPSTETDRLIICVSPSRQVLFDPLTQIIF